MCWPARSEVVLAEWSPECAHRRHAGGVAGDDVVHRIPDEDRIRWLATEAVQCQPYGFRVGLVSRARVAADDRVHVAREAVAGQSAEGERLRLARDDADLVSALPE